MKIHTKEELLGMSTEELEKRLEAIQDGKYPKFCRGVTGFVQKDGKRVPTRHNAPIYPLNAFLHKEHGFVCGECLMLEQEARLEHGP